MIGCWDSLELDEDGVTVYDYNMQGVFCWFIFYFFMQRISVQTAFNKSIPTMSVDVRTIKSLSFNNREEIHTV